MFILIYIPWRPSSSNTTFNTISSWASSRNKTGITSNSIRIYASSTTAWTWTVIWLSTTFTTSATTEAAFEIISSRTFSSYTYSIALTRKYTFSISSIIWSTRYIITTFNTIWIRWTLAWINCTSIIAAWTRIYTYTASIAAWN